MSLPKKSSWYPREFIEFALRRAEEVASGGRTIRVEYQELKTAQRARFLFYGFRRACELDNPTIAEKLRGVVARVQKTSTGAVLEFGSVSDSDSIAPITAMLRAQTMAPETSTLIQATEQTESNDELFARLGFSGNSGGER